MPELPEVETTVRGIEPFLAGRTIRDVRVREPRLRWPVSPGVQKARGERVSGVTRRAKYILVHLENGTLLIHLGMSGSLCVLGDAPVPGKHDHFDIVLDEYTIRFNDPRRFGAFLWWDQAPDSHPLLASLGPEPFSDPFNADYLYHRSRGRKVAAKHFVMDGKVVVGVGNIYASEALFIAGIHPTRPAGRISHARYEGLVDAIRDVLDRAIRQGGTTLRDFSGSTGAPGYFAQELLVYGRAGEPCFQCGAEIRQKVIGQRSSFYCIHCQR